jgi:hypothetical protein
MTISAAIRLWRQFWFAPEDSSAISLYRIFYGLLVLQIAVIHLGSNFLDWYGPKAIVTLPTVIKYFWHNEPRFDWLLLLPQTDSAISGFHIAFIAAAGIHDHWFWHSLQHALRLALTSIVCIIKIRSISMVAMAFFGQSDRG